MTPLSERADRFVRSVFKLRGPRAVSADPKKEAEIKNRFERLQKARAAAIKARKGF